MPTLTISPESLQSVIRSSETAGASLKASPKTFATGEVLNVLVAGHHGPKVRIQIGNSSLIADSPVQFPVGEKLTVRVDQSHPSLVLKIIGQTETEALNINESLKLYRSNPGALRDVLTGLRELLGGNGLDGLDGRLNPKDRQALSNLLEKIIISKNQLAHPQYLKESIEALGLTVERDLLKALADPASLAEAKGATLKEILLGLSGELQTADRTGYASGTERLQTDGLSRLVDQALRVIESLQIVNVLAQEQDQLLAFQVPFQCADGIRMQDLFIETDRDANRSGKGRPGKVVLFLDMDALGEMVVETFIQEESLQCTIRCHSEDATDYLAGFLPEIQERLASLGYVAPKVRCALDRELGAWKQDFLMEHKLFSRNAIDVCA